MPEVNLVPTSTQINFTDPSRVCLSMEPYRKAVGKNPLKKKMLLKNAYSPQVTKKDEKKLYIKTRFWIYIYIGMKNFFKSNPSTNLPQNRKFFFKRESKNPQRYLGISLDRCL